MSTPTEYRRLFGELMEVQAERDAAQYDLKQLRAAVAALADNPHVIQVQTIDGVELAPAIWPDDLRALLAADDALGHLREDA